MEISKHNVKLQYLMIFCVCIFGCGAYFVFDSPASVQRYLMAAMGYTSTSYMDLYTWYSAPGILTCILGGVAIDNFLGRRLGGIVFCCFIFGGQLIYAFSMSKSMHIAACIGRMVIGAGVECVAVCSNCYLSWWFEGTRLKSLAFGLALSIWRLSSSISLATMLPLYENINSVSPQDGTGSIFTTCVESKCDGSMYEMNVFRYEDENGKVIAADRGPYYCYDKDILDSCKFEAENYEDFLNGDKSFCKTFSKEAESFFNVTGARGKCVWNEDQMGYIFSTESCNCLDDYYMPDWAYYDEHKSKFPEIPSAEEYRPPFYWTENFGSYTSGDDFMAQFEIFRQLKNEVCKKQGLEIANGHDTLANDVTKWEAKFDGFKADEQEKYGSKAGYVQSLKQATILDPMSTNAKTLGLFVGKLNGKEVFSKTCGEGSVLVKISQEDTDERIDGISTCYYIMLIVTVLSVGMAVFLFKIDGKAEANFNEEQRKKGIHVSEEKEAFSVSGLINAIKNIPVNIWILYVMCVCFYVGVFTFVTQAPMFFERHSGLNAQAAGFCVSLVYILAVPCNPLMGAIIAKVRCEQGFLFAAYIVSALAHFIMLSFKNVLAAFGGMTLLGISYAMIGTTMWPLVGSLVDPVIVGKVFGLMFATQQGGLTIGAWFAGFINDKMGWYGVEAFFIILQLIGAGLAFILLTRVGLNTPERESPNQDSPQDAEEEKALKLDDI